jgi:hypothetical protein
VAIPKSYEFVTVEEQTIEPFNGVFKDEDGSLVRFHIEQGKPFLDVSAESSTLGGTYNSRYILFPVATDRFLIKDLMAEIYFPEAEEGGRISKLQFISGGEVSELKKVNNRLQRNFTGPPERDPFDDEIIH